MLTIICFLVLQHPVHALNIVHLGDSYSSGNGAGNYEDAVCFRSPDNWGATMASLLDDGVYQNAACSGSKTSDLATQDSAVTASTDLVIVATGGNDLEFGSIVDDCYIPPRDGGDCQSLLAAAVSKLDAYESALTQALVNIESLLGSNQAKVVLVAYPHITQNIPYSCCSLNNREVTSKARSLGVAFDKSQRNAVNAANTAAGRVFVHFYDETKALFNGHEPHPSAFSQNPDRWIFEYDCRGVFNDCETTIEFDEETYHLNPRGHLELGTALATFVGDLLAAPLATHVPSQAPSPAPIETSSPTIYADPSAVFCSQSPDIIELDARETKLYSCSGTAGSPVHLIWKTAAVNGPQGFSDDEYFINVYQDNAQVYRSNHIEDLAGTQQSSGLIGTFTSGGSSISVEFECNLEFSSADCDDGSFEFKLVECGCPNGSDPIEPCNVASLETTRDAVCDPSAPPATPSPPGSSPSPSPGGGSDAACFSGLGQVHVEHQPEPVNMKDLRIGDRVLTSNKQNSYQQIYGFAHRHEMQPTIFYRIVTEHSHTESLNALEISGEHLVFVRARSGPVRADSIQVGDTLVQWKVATSTYDFAIVKEISKLSRDGLYAPLTPDGTIVVNDIVASTYVNVQGTTRSPGAEYVELGRRMMVTPLLQSQAIHLWFSPLRLICTHHHSAFCERHDEDGMLSYARLGLELVSWGKAQYVWVQTTVLTSALLITGSCYLLELTIQFMGVSVLLMLVCLAILVHRDGCRRRAAARKATGSKEDLVRTLCYL